MDAVQGRVVSRLAHVDIEGLTVRYGSVTALDRLDLAIAGGEMFVLLGGSGSGKTTLLRALGGFIRPTAGRIGLAGQDITRLPPHRRPVNTTFQSYALFPHMSVADNVGFGLRRQGVELQEMVESIRMQYQDTVSRAQRIEDVRRQLLERVEAVEETLATLEQEDTREDTIIQRLDKQILENLLAVQERAEVIRAAGAPVVCETPGGLAGQTADIAWLRSHVD